MLLRTARCELVGESTHKGFFSNDLVRDSLMPLCMTHNAVSRRLMMMVLIHDLIKLHFLHFGLNSSINFAGIHHIPPLT